MYQLIKDFPQQIIDGLANESIVELTNIPSKIEHVLVSGLGGSGIGGNLVAELVSKELNVPIIVNKGYDLPHFAGPNTFLILCSYSGNTEETLSVAEQAIAKGIKPVCISTGGALKPFADKHALDFVPMPGGFPPRSFLAFSSLQLLHVLHAAKLISATYKTDWNAAATLLTEDQDELMQVGKLIADLAKRRILILYTEDKNESAALRIKQQINENSKALCYYNVIPEMNHNELVGWKGVQSKLVVLFLRTHDENPRNTARMEANKEVTKKYAHTPADFLAKGNSRAERLLYLIHFGDWLSYYIAEFKNIDAVEVNVITELKNKLAAIQ